MRLHHWFTTFIVVLGVGIASGQVATGTPPFGSFGGGPFDTINLGNLNVHFAIPVLNKAGRGTPFSYSLGYDSSVWYPVMSNGVTSWEYLSNWGWTVEANALGGSIKTSSEAWVCVILGPPIQKQQVNATVINSYVDPTGTSHPFFVLEDPCHTGNKFTQTSFDGSGWTLTYQGGITATSRTGAAVAPAIGANGGSYTDTNGNQLFANGSGQYFDTLSSTTPVLTLAGAMPRLQIPRR